MVLGQQGDAGRLPSPVLSIILYALSGSPRPAQRIEEAASRKDGCSNVAASSDSADDWRGQSEGWQDLAGDALAGLIFGHEQ